MNDADTTKISKIAYEKTDGVFGIYRLQELCDDGSVITWLQNGEKLIWFESSSVRMFQDLNDRQSVFAKRPARENETATEDNTQASDVSSDRRINIELVPDCFFGTVGSPEQFKQITLVVTCNTQDTEDNICVVRPFLSHCYFSLRLSSSNFNFVWEAIRANPLAAIRFGVQDGSIHHDDDPVGGFRPLVAKVLTHEVAKEVESSCESPMLIWTSSEVSAQFQLLVTEEFTANPKNVDEVAKTMQPSVETEGFNSERIRELLEHISSFKSELAWLRILLILLLITSVISIFLMV